MFKIQIFKKREMKKKKCKNVNLYMYPVWKETHRSIIFYQILAVLTVWN